MIHEAAQKKTPNVILFAKNSPAKKKMSVKRRLNGTSLAINMMSLFKERKSFGNVGQEHSPWGAVARTGGTVA